MKKYVIFNLPAHGHINPTLAVVKELIERGNIVIYYAVDEFKEKIEKTGAEFRSYNIDISKIDIQRLTNLFVLMETLLEFTDQITLNLMEEVRKENPDCIIHDSVCPWGKIIGEKIGIPTVNSITTFAINNKVARYFIKSSNVITDTIKNVHSILRIINIINRLKKKNIDISGINDLLINKENLNIVYTSKEFQPYGNSFDETFEFVGPSIVNREESMEELSNVNREKPVIYISLGTIVNQNIEFYRNCFNALENIDATIIMSVGKSIKISRLGNIPKNFIVKKYVPQLEVLSSSDIFITHGGMNSVHEGLYYKVPLIVIPGQKEQEMVARRIEDCEIGIYMENEDVLSIRNSIKKILAHPKYIKNVEHISNTLIKAGGYLKAVDKIEEYVS